MMYIFLHPNAPFYVKIRDNLPHVGVRIFCYYQRLKLSCSWQRFIHCLFTFPAISLLMVTENCFLVSEKSKFLLLHGWHPCLIVEAAQR